MPYVIGIGLAVILLVFLVGGALMIVAYLTSVLAIPSIAGMRMVQALGLTDPGWYVALHAAVGAAAGFWAPLAGRLFAGSPVRPLTKQEADRLREARRGSRRGPLAKAVAGLWSRLPGRGWVLAVLIVILVIAVFNVIPWLLEVLRILSRG